MLHSPPCALNPDGLTEAIDRGPSLFGLLRLMTSLLLLKVSIQLVKTGRIHHRQWRWGLSLCGWADDRLEAL